MSDKPGSRRTFRVGWWTSVPLVLLLGGAAYVLLPQIGEVDATFTRWRRLNAWLLALAALAQAGSHLSGAFMVQRVARLTGDRLSLGRALRLGLAASAVGLVAAGPVGYAAATMHWLKRRGVSDEGATLLGWLPALLNAGSLVALALASVVLLLARGVALPWPVAGALAVIFALLLTAMALPLLAGERRVAAIMGVVRRGWRRLRRRDPGPSTLGADRARVAAARQALARGGWKGVLLGTVLRAALDVTTVWALFLSTGTTIATANLIAGYAVPQVLGRVIAGGVGLVEGGMVGLFVALGVASSTSIVVALSYRLLSFWLPLFVGIPLALIEQRAAARAG